jgi:hypothetical protein
MSDIFGGYGRNSYSSSRGNDKTGIILLVLAVIVAVIAVRISTRPVSCLTRIVSPRARAVVRCESTPTTAAPS